tara:strand:- start:472 stop:1116 length:645 start_codon:yes stop_codon:yes gene_type:complete
MNKKSNLKYSIILLLFCLSISSQDYDILIQNGHVIDIKNKIDDVYDIAISKNKVVAVSKKIDLKDAKRVIDASGLIVVPGLIDIHSHNFHGTIPNRYLSNSFSALPPDGFSFRSGITTIVDVGGAGWRNFEVFKNQVIDRSQTRVLSFLNIVGFGMQGGAVEQNIDDMNSEMTAEIVKKYPDEIVGIKLAHFNGYNWLLLIELLKREKSQMYPL